jgi:hypothetical protein
MSPDHIDGEHNAEVLPLRATDAGTETKVAEAAGPAYTDLTDGRPARKPVIPAHWRTREAARSVSSSPPPGMGTPPPTTASACRATCS